MAAQREGGVKASDYDMYQAIIDVMGTIPDAMMVELGSKAMRVKMPPTDLKKEYIEFLVESFQTKADSGDQTVIQIWKNICHLKKQKIAFFSVGGPDPYTGIKTSLEDVKSIIEKIHMLSDLGLTPYIATMGRTEQHISDALKTQLKNSGHHSYFEYFTENKERTLIEILADGTSKDIASKKLHYHIMLWLCDFRIATDDSLSTIAEGGMFGKPAAIYMLKDSEKVLPRKQVREYLRDHHKLSILTAETKLDQLKQALIQNVSPPCEPNIDIIQHIKKALKL
ncbi:MAG: hypothetical protein JW812_03030 [Alphaproteobacteria bacterium]|nr:hypothetical protein [Alphaproteobacteria bacterium]MBN2779719.1 hypothetical protein [Alphaproteobacteria bacterium]